MCIGLYGWLSKKQVKMMGAVTIKHISTKYIVVHKIKEAVVISDNSTTKATRYENINNISSDIKKVDKNHDLDRLTNYSKTKYK